MRLKDKCIIVTGSTTGIGQAIAERCVRHGGRVLIHGRDEQRGQAVAQQLGDAAKFCRADLARPDAPRTLVEAALKHMGRIDGLVNNAAYTHRGTIDAVDAETFDRVMHINLRAPLLLIQAALPHLTQTAGCVLNIGSINGLCGEVNQLLYSISKGGLVTLSRNLADAHATTGVRVNHFVLGWVLTENEKQLKQTEGMPDGWWNDMPRAFVPSGSMTPPETIADAAVYWLGDESRPINGSVIEFEQYPMIGRNPPKVDD